MARSRSSVQDRGGNVRRDGLSENEPGMAPLCESRQQRLLLSAVPFADDLNDTFSLHSNSTAAKIIYWDFDGHTTTAGWNVVVEFITPAFNFDGGGSVFADVEKARFEKIWERASEDHIPLDVDITTQEPPWMGL